MNVLVIALDAETPVVVPESEVFVVAPALNSRLRRWLSDEDEARRLAGKRADAAVERLERRGLHAHAQVGDGDPLQAIEDALRTFAPDELVISTHPEGRSNWLERQVVSGARERFVVPVTHVVVDLEAESHQPTGY
jgi:nucleotide-binding universal stress UspA family protein